MKTLIEILLFMLILVAAISSTASSPAFASPETWSEVVTYSGPGRREAFNSSVFTIDHPEWRIRWAFTPKPEPYEGAGLWVLTYREGQTVPNWVNMIFEYNSSRTSGTSYIHNQTGNFYMTIVAPDSDLNYTIIVEQDLDSFIPEYPTLILLPLFLAATLAVAVITAFPRRNRQAADATLKTN